MEDKTYIIKKSDIMENGYVVVPVSCLEEAGSVPEHEDGDEVSY